MNTLSPAVLAQLFSQESSDPFLTLVTLSHPDFDTIRLVNNSVDIISRGNTFMAFPLKIRLPADDGETARNVTIEFDNVSLLLIEEIRSVTTAIEVKLEMVLASIPDDVQIEVADLSIQSLNYNRTKVSAVLVMDSLLNTALTSEIYSPTNFPGLF